MTGEIESVRHAHERGDILRVLKEDYQQEMTGVRTLIRSLDLMNVPLSYDGLVFHLQYLETSGYVQLWRNRDLPSFRRDRTQAGSAKPSSIMFSKLLPKGLQLLDGLIPEDPSVAF